MRLFLFILVMLLSFPALAEEAAPQQAERVQIVTDQEAGAVRIVIDGQPVAIIDATGLYVVNDIAYGGNIVDTGTAWIKQRMNSGEEKDAE